MKTIFAATLLGSLIVGAGAAHAMPLATVGTTASPAMIRVAGGCGENRYRTPAGVCQPIKGAVVVPGPVVAAPPRVCPVGQVLSRSGSCRPI